MSADVIFSHETHIKLKLKADSGQIGFEYYQSTFSSKAREVAILLRKSVPFQWCPLTTDPSGRYLIVSGKIIKFPSPVLIYSIWPKFRWPWLHLEGFQIVTRSEFYLHDYRWWLQMLLRPLSWPSILTPSSYFVCLFVCLLVGWFVFGANRTKEL